SVTDHKAYAVGNGNEFELQRPAVEQQGVPGFAKAGDELIHDANARAHESILGPLTKLGHLGHGKDRTIEAHESQSAGDFQCGGRTETSPDRNLATNQQVGAVNRGADLLQDRGDADDVITPRPKAFLGEVLDIKLEMLRELLGVQHQLSVRAGRDRNPGFEADRAGHYEAV